jgi:Fur family ferric uptake transcriptional regulator
MDASLKYLKQLGLKVTQPRLKILNIFETSKQHHLSVEEVYQILQNSKQCVGISTVYRVISQFEVAGIIKRLNLGRDQSVYELDYGERHDHMTCVKCNVVEEFTNPIIDFCHRKVVLEKGARLVKHSSIIYIECSRCLKNSSS